MSSYKVKPSDISSVTFALSAPSCYDLCCVSFSNGAKKSINQSNHPGELSSSPSAELLLLHFFFPPASYSYFRFDKTRDGHIPE